MGFARDPFGPAFGGGEATVAWRFNSGDIGEGGVGAASTGSSLSLMAVARSPALPGN